MERLPASLQAAAARKLQRGCAQLDAGQLELALLSLHGALEDHLRALFADHDAAMIDPAKRSWKDLGLQLSIRPGVTAEERALVLSANRNRMDVAHGGTMQWSRTEVSSYAEYVMSVVAGEHRSLAAGRAPLLRYCVRCGATDVGSRCVSVLDHSFVTASPEIPTILCRRCARYPGLAADCIGVLGHDFVGFSARSVRCARCATGRKHAERHCIAIEGHDFRES